MNNIRVETCPTCSENELFDPQKAFEQLAKKQTELAEIVAKYMSEAGLERATRASNALAMAERVDRIVGGRPVQRGGFPECCLIGQRFPNGAERWFCTGVLIHPQVVLTAAHCHNPPSLNATIIALNMEDMNQFDERTEFVSVRRVVIHPDYPTTRRSDIAVLILRQRARVAPVSLVSTAELVTANSTTLVGFGNDDVHSTRGFGKKREVEVPITHLRRRASDNLDEAEQTLGFESDLEFVAGGQGFDSCNGDSGGPAYVLIGGRRKLCGLTSRSTSTATLPCGEGGIYTRVDLHLDFVRRVMLDANLKLDNRTPRNLAARADSETIVLGNCLSLKRAGEVVREAADVAPETDMDTKLGTLMTSDERRIFKQDVFDRVSESCFIRKSDIPAGQNDSLAKVQIAIQEKSSKRV